MAVDTLFAPDAVDHDPAPDQAPAARASVRSSRDWPPRFPTHLEPDTTVVDDEHVAFAYTLTGTHQGDFNGVAPTGKQLFQVRGLQIGRFANGQIVEPWGSTDELGILQQLGATATPTEQPSLIDKVKNVFTP